MKTLRKCTLMFSLILLAGFFSPANAQILPDPDCDPLDPACPIDGGLSLLIAAGICVGAKKAYSNKKTTTIM